MRAMIGWIGLGKCGLPIAEKIAETVPVLAYDIVAKEVKHCRFVTAAADLLSTDMVFILVQTPHANQSLDGSTWMDLNDTEDYDYTALSSVLATLSSIKYDRPVVISSTVSPGTISRLSVSHPTLSLAYMPVMIHISSVARDYVTAPMYFIGSYDSRIGDAVQTMLERFVETKTFLHGTPDEVELYKMLGNMFSSVKIAFANTISEMIEYGKLNASSWHVMQALLHDTINFNSPAYLLPGSGNGGPCHPRDGVVLSYLTDRFGMRSHLLKDVTQARQDQALALAEHLVSYGLPIVILGKSFKQGVDLTVGSYSVLVGNLCEGLGATVEYDRSIGEDAVVLLAHRNADLLVLHPPTTDSIVVDLWNIGIENHRVKVWGNRLVNA